MKETDLRKEAERSRQLEAELLAARATVEQLREAVTTLESRPVMPEGAVDGAEHARVVGELSTQLEAAKADHAAVDTMRAACAQSQAALRQCRADMAAVGDEMRHQIAAAQGACVFLSPSLPLPSYARAHANVVYHRLGDCAKVGAALTQALHQAQADAAQANARYLRESKQRRKVQNQLAEAKGNIRVFCRVRPPSAAEAASDEMCIAPTSETEVMVGGDSKRAEHCFEYDRVFGPDSTQHMVFEEMQPLAMAVLDGFNSCIFAYGQTGAGKTHTMTGTPDDLVRRTAALLVCERGVGVTVTHRHPALLSVVVV